MKFVVTFHVVGETRSDTCPILTMATRIAVPTINEALRKDGYNLQLELYVAKVEGK